MATDWASVGTLGNKGVSNTGPYEKGPTGSEVGFVTVTKSGATEATGGGRLAAGYATVTDSLSGLCFKKSKDWEELMAASYGPITVESG